MRRVFFESLTHFLLQCVTNTRLTLLSYHSANPRPALNYTNPSGDTQLFISFVHSQTSVYECTCLNGFINSIHRPVFMGVALNYLFVLQ